LILITVSKIGSQRYFFFYKYPIIFQLISKQICGFAPLKNGRPSTVTFLRLQFYRKCRKNITFLDKIIILEQQIQIKSLIFKEFKPRKGNLSGDGWGYPFHWGMSITSEVL